MIIATELSEHFDSVGQLLASQAPHCATKFSEEVAAVS